MNFVTYKQMQKDVISWATKLPRDFDAIVGIERSGMLPATILALHLHLPLLTLDDLFNVEKSYVRSKVGVKDIKRVLVVDDSVSSGKTLKAVRNRLSSMSSLEIYYGVVYNRSDKTVLLDFVFKPIEQPRLFEWNFIHHVGMEKAVFDMDGVLCVDPPHEDKTKEYVDYISNAIPLYIPSVKILGIATARLEKYREVTENWLHKMGIKYNFLEMVKEETPQDRRKRVNIAKYKADVLLKSGGLIFVESSRKQSEDIRKMTGKAVICIEDL